MNSTVELTTVIDALIRIRDAGLLPDLEHEIARARRGPRCDLDRWPNYRLAIEELTRLTVRLTGLSEPLCRDAVCERLLPMTRRRIALRIIREFAARLDRQSQAAADISKLARERARRQTV